MHSSIYFSQLTVCAFEKAHSRLPEKTNGNLVNQRKHNFYKDDVMNYCTVALH